MKDIIKKVAHWLGPVLLLTVLMAACGGTASTPPETAVPSATATERPSPEAPETNGSRTGDIAPDFTLLDSNGSPVTLSDELKEHRSVVLVFYNAHD